MNILCDYDSTLAHTFTAQLKALNDKFGTDYKRNMFTTWNTEEILTKEEVVFLWGPECFMNEEFQAACKPVENAVEAVKIMQTNGHQFIIASDRPDELYDVTKDWLARHDLGDIKLVFTKHKSSVGTPTKKSLSKLDVIEQYSISAAIDDAPHHATNFAALPQIEQVYLLTYPYNRGIVGDKIIRCKNWKDLLQKFTDRNSPYYQDTETGHLITRNPVYSAVPA